MSPMEKEEVKQRISAMDMEEQKVAAERLDDEVLFGEVTRRISKLETRVGGMITLITEEEQRIEATQQAIDLQGLYQGLLGMYLTMRKTLLGKENDR